MKSALNPVSRNEMFSSFGDDAKQIKNTYVQYMKTVRSNPRKTVVDLQNMWSASAKAANISNPAAISLSGKMLSNAERVNGIAQQAMRSKNLMYTQMASNMAVVGLPTLSASIGTLAITKAMFGRDREQF